jgi:DNA-binding NarL/FixJ family response regulator
MLKALIVDDNAEFRSFLTALLSERFPDGVVHEAADALQALRLLAEDKHDIVLVDIGLPGAMNGLSLVARIREHSRRPILILSNYVLPEYQLEASRLGADWFLPKVGASAQDIIAAIERLILMGATRPES